MAGGSSGSSALNNSSSSSSFAATGGRERAIEALIDREPQGDYYRAARVIVRSCFVSSFKCIHDIILLFSCTLTQVFCSNFSYTVG